ncbi:MAG TPA: methyltransferase domain-containing protein [Candidatus Lokiarchaeia archaeon]|nr:methyltransferase domain-containing protein [Candidatus Lokiarchaeia archaeon]
MTPVPEKNDPGARDHFNKWSKTYENTWEQKIFFQRVHRAVIALAITVAPDVGTILDVGCGTGKLLRAAGVRWPNAARIGVDAVEGMIEVAQDLTPDVTFHVGVAENLPLPDSSVDLVFSTTSFHHWTDQTAGLGEVARVLRPGGHFFLADIALPMGNSFKGKGKIRTLFTNAGLQVFAQKRVAFHVTLVTGGIKQGI